MYRRYGFLFVPDLQHFGRSVDSNKGLLNNRFHSLTQEGPAWPRGVSCSFEHLNPHAASDFPLLFAGGCSFTVFVCALWLWKGSSLAVYRELLAVKDHLIEIIKPQLIELLHIYVGAQVEHIVLMKNSSVRDGEPDLTSPSLDRRGETRNKQSALSPNVCCPLLPAAVNTHITLSRLIR